jgi:hypothetical protein
MVVRGGGVIDNGNEMKVVAQCRKFTAQYRACHGSLGNRLRPVISAVAAERGVGARLLGKWGKAEKVALTGYRPERGVCVWVFGCYLAGKS